MKKLTFLVKVEAQNIFHEDSLHISLSIYTHTHTHMYMCIMYVRIQICPHFSAVILRTIYSSFVQEALPYLLGIGGLGWSCVALSALVTQSVPVCA